MATFRGAVSVNKEFDRIVFPYWGHGYAISMFPVICDSYVKSLTIIRTPEDQLDWEDIEDLSTCVGPVLEDRRQRRPADLFHSSVPFGGSGRRNTDMPGQDRRTKFYDCHRARNRFLVALANELSEELTREPARHRVSLLATTIPYARSLANLLPGWPVLKATSRTSVLPARSIVTLPAAHEMHNRHVFDPTHLIVAMGGPPGAWLGQYLRDRARGYTPLHLFDLTDNFCQDAKDWAEARKEMYGNAGSHWRPVPRDVVKRVSRAARRRSRGRSSTSSPEVGS